MHQHDICNYLELYFDDCDFNRRLSSKTIKAYKIDLKQFTEFMKERDYSDVSLITDYIHQLNVQYPKYKTVKRKIASVKAFYSFLEYENILDTNPFRKIRSQRREPKILPKTISSDIIKVLFKCVYQDLDVAKTDYAKRYRLRNIVLLELLFTTGVRISELCNLKINDINISDQTMKLFGKGSKERILYLGNDEVIQLLKKYIQINKMRESESEYLFQNKFGNKLSEQSVRNFLNALEKRLNLTVHITPHMFRHTFATLLLEKDVDIRYIQKILGHSSISVTQIYADVTSNKQKEIMTLKNPRNDYHW